MHLSRTTGMKTLVLILAVGLSSCSTAKRNESAQNGVREFHSRLDAEKYDELYAMTSDEFRGVTSEAEFTTLLRAVHRKLGNVRAADLARNEDNWHIGYVVVLMTYNTHFTEGEASEQFIWRIDDDHIVLVGYHINSPVFVTK